MDLTDGKTYNVWDTIEVWASELPDDQREAYLAACLRLVEPHRTHQRFKLLYADLRSRGGVSESDYPGLDPSLEPEQFADASLSIRSWPLFWLTHFGEHLAADECECDRREGPPLEWPEWWEDGARGERILDAQLTCLIEAAGGTTDAVPVFRSMMKEWPGGFSDLVATASRLAAAGAPQ